MKPSDRYALTRRGLVGAGFGLALPTFATAAVPANGRLSFAVFRNGDRVGEHVMRFSRSGGGIDVSTEAEMVVKLGPVPVFRYTHTATERWRGGDFASLSTQTNSNGKRERVSAEASASGVRIEGPSGQVNAPAGTAPLTHWNTAAFDGPLFNPQLGKLLKVSVSRAGREQVRTAGGAAIPATRWTIRGEAEIDNWYDADGVWAGLSGRLEDGSTLLYRRL